MAVAHTMRVAVSMSMLRAFIVMCISAFGLHFGVKAVNYTGHKTQACKINHKYDCKYFHKCKYKHPGSKKPF